MSEGSVSRLLIQLRTADPGQAQAELFRRYYPKLVREVQRRTQAAFTRAADEEDIAVSAMMALFDGAARDQYARLEDRRNLWALLVTIAARMTANLANRKRLRGDSAFRASPDKGEPPDPKALPADAGAIASEEVDRLLRQLDDDSQRFVALLKLDHCTNPEIARVLGCSLSSVERRLTIIRRIWRRELE